LAIGLCVAGILATAFVLVQRRGFALLDRLARVLGRGWADKTVAGAAALHSGLSAIYRLRRRLVYSFALHLACWLASTLEVWVALRFTGAALGFATVLAMETLLYAVRSFAFAVPNAVGVQEGAYVLLSTGFGLSPETALALSLLKRARDLTIGFPALAGWQLLEGGRLWRHVAGSRNLRPQGERNPGRDGRGPSLVSWLR
jgi:hypothetical protein